jgi:hypothetical protein
LIRKNLKAVHPDVIPVVRMRPIWSRGSSG